jgi:hypothetical protein
MLRLSGGSSKLFEIIHQTSVIYSAALQTPSIPLSSAINRRVGIGRLLVNLEIVPPPSLVNQIAFLVKEHTFTLQQPQLLNLVDT